MIRFLRDRILPVFAALCGIAAVASAEAVFPVNDAGTGVFDQAATALLGATVHTAYIGGASTAGPFRLYYTAVNANTDFTNKATVRSQVFLTPPVPIDNTLYTDVRHPQIATRNNTEAVIVFQGIPVGGTEFKLFRARLTLANNAVTSQSVSEIVDASGIRLAGRLTDPSFGILANDSFLRIAYASSPSLIAPSPFTDVYYARVGIDNATVLGSPILMTRTTAVTGVTPLPRLQVETNQNRSHIVWAANTPTTAPSDIYYGMVKEISPGVDTLAIGSTSILSGGLRWGFPAVQLQSANRVLVLAGIESGTPGVAGQVGISFLYPDAVTHDGNPVNIGNQISGRTFLIFPPASNTPLPETFSANHPEMFLDSSSRVHVAGYGFSGSDGHGSPGTYYTMALQGISQTTATLAELLMSRVTIGGSDPTAFGLSLDNDYTRPAFAHISGRTVHFWSGMDNTVAGARNLYVTASLSTTDLQGTKQSGCSMVAQPHTGESERIPGAALLFLPAAFLALRRGFRKAFVR